MPNPKAKKLEAKAAWEAANEAVESAQEALRVKRRGLEEAAHDSIRKALAADQDRVSDLRHAERVAREALDDAVVAERRAAMEGPAEGTVLVEWKRPRTWGYTVKLPAPKLTGRRGVVEVWTRESVAPTNVRWGLPTPGALVVRILKKDGTPSRAFEPLEQGTWRGEWLPEGQKPKGVA